MYGSVFAFMFARRGEARHKEEETKMDESRVLSGLSVVATHGLL